MTTGLLVSVRDAAEAKIALAAGVDLIDIKEPMAGSLGAAGPETIGQIVRAVGGARPISVALGELVETASRRTAIMDRLRSCGGVSLAKIGLAGTIAAAGPARDWRHDWREALRTFPPAISGVAVVYADWRTAAAPPPRNVIQAGNELGCRTMLIDTFDKRLPGLLHFWSIDEISDCAETARAAGMRVVLAGRIGADELPAVLGLAPDLIAVRGAVCGGDRAGSLDAMKLRDFLRRMDAARESRTYQAFVGTTAPR